MQFLILRLLCLCLTSYISIFCPLSLFWGVEYFVLFTARTTFSTYNGQFSICHLVRCHPNCIYLNELLRYQPSLTLHIKTFFFGGGGVYLSPQREHVAGGHLNILIKAHWHLCVCVHRQAHWHTANWWVHAMLRWAEAAIVLGWFWRWQPPFLPPRAFSLFHKHTWQTTWSVR